MKITMTPKAKIEYVKRQIEDKRQISPKGLLSFNLYTLTEYEDGPVLLSNYEQQLIIKKLEQDGYVKNVSFENDGFKVTLEVVEKEKEGRKERVKDGKKSKHSNKIKTIDDLLMNIPLRDKCSVFFDSFSGLEGNCGYDVDDEEKKETVFLLEDLGLISAVFECEEEQPQEIIVTLHPEKIAEFTDRVRGKKSVIKKQALEFIARHIGELDSGTNLVEFLKDCGVPDSLIVYPNTKWRMIYDVLLYYACMPKFQDRKILAEIIERAAHPLMHNGDKKAAEETVKKFNSFLQYDGFSIDDNGILWKEWNDPSGVPSWYNKDGNEIETPVYMILPDKISKLYFYWNELIKLTKFYLNNRENQDDEINNIYFEIIRKVEDLIRFNEGCGILKEIYKRPFGHIIGCEFEMQEKGLNPDGILLKLYDFLNEITQTSLPDKKEIEEIKTKDADFLKKINNYIGQHSTKPESEPEHINESENKETMTTTRIEIVKIPELEIRGLQEKTILRKSKNSEIALQQFPKDLKWEDITIQFFNGQDVMVKAKNKVINANFETMGFMDEKRKLPNKQWELLIALSKRNGEMSWQNNKNLSQKDIDAIKKRKQNLSDTLKTYFQISDDPFSDYNKEKMYKIKINLIPENSRIDDEQKDDLGLKEYLTKEAPQINDKS